MDAPFQGVLPIDKPAGITSFKLVAWCRKATNVKKIGHAGTLDPFATGVMLLMIGRDYTRISEKLMCEEKEYETTLHLGIETNTFDNEGEVVKEDPTIPTLKQIQEILIQFQGWQEQTPPMFSAKKIDGQKLYDLARKGITIERAPAKVYMEISLLEYTYPLLRLHVRCSKGTYIRSMAQDIGNKLLCGAHLIQLRRTRSGNFNLDHCINGELLRDGKISLDELNKHLLTFSNYEFNLAN